ncbi:MotB family protein [Prosthecomicrobium pneumaticum]|uniref:Chemotaxis protein MotB n=1 Tax=Prosthecomicrobium pneumaticum TaxID=81895 RepID=A0A7W9CSA4_9HYPH|nr:MotB family protein [Prosthecomicrobium pneumaticum]MBB5751013.1 chemotaxis protein MotB [Prosthecomicrobium pneumaticum]
MADHEHELIIIKRHDDEEHEHHSSAWKVAHADFMTAMMAFFLIMWLINVTDKDVRKAIANYFNPVDLAESISERKGLNDPQDTSDAGTSADGESMSTLKNTAGEKTGAGEDVQQGKHESALFQDPYAVLAEIAAEAAPGTATSPDAAIGDQGSPGNGNGDTHRDPFDPSYWQMTSNREARTDAPPTGGITPPSGGEPDARAARTDLPPSDQPGESPPAAGESPDGSPDAPTQDTADTRAAETGSGNAAAQTADGKPASLSETIRADVAGAMNGAAGPQVEVRQTKEGLVVSLTDDIDFSMFPIGSAVPDARLIEAMRRIAGTLASRPGTVVIRGYTDARPFRSANYDNWQLSAARANIAHYMLVRGGLDERRIGRIEGFADRNLKNEADPNAPENRRIEILLQQEPAR